MDIAFRSVSGTRAKITQAGLRRHHADGCARHTKGWVILTFG
jgi:hypothetical protein